MTESRTPATAEHHGRRGGRFPAPWRPAAWVLVLLGWGLAAPLPAAEKPMVFGYSSTLFSEVNDNDARAALKVWAKILSDQLGIPADTKIDVMTGVDQMRDALLAGRIDGVSVTSLEFWTLRRSMRLGSTVFVGVANGQTTREYVLLVHRDNPAVRLADLRGQSLAVIGPVGDNLAGIWVESLLLEENLGLSPSFWGTTTRAVKPSRVVLPVFFRQAAAGVVTREEFRLMSELNPQVGRDLRILAHSPALVPTVCCFRPDLISPVFDRVRSDFARVVDTPAGRQLLALFHTDLVVVRPVSDLDATVAFLDRHQRLLAEAGVRQPTREPALAGGKEKGNR